MKDLRIALTLIAICLCGTANAAAREAVSKAVPSAEADSVYFTSPSQHLRAGLLSFRRCATAARLAPADAIGGEFRNNLLRVGLSDATAARLGAYSFATGSSYNYQFAVINPRQLSYPEYVSELDRITALTNQALENPTAAREATNDLRGGWKVDAEGQSFTVNTGWLVDQFEKLEKNPSSSVRDDILQRLGAMKANAEAFQQAPLDTSAARAKLTQILSRSEFHQVHGATWWDRLKFRIAMWIFRMLSKFFGSSSAPTVGRFFVWGLVTIAVLALAYFIFRTIRQNARLETIMPEVLPVSAKQWRVWMKEARAAAAKGLWRDAVHLAYWGGISFLEESGAWRPDQARTPREYLRLLPADSQHRAALSTLTRRLEVTWYGNEVAGPETFNETLSHLEGLGCRE